MATADNSRSERRGTGRIRPIFLAAGIALMWFAEFQREGLEPDAPDWAVAVFFGGRLAADFVGSLVVVSLVQLCIALARLGFLRWREHHGAGDR